VNFPLRVDALAPLASQLTHADDLIHPEGLLRGVEPQEPGIVAVAGRADVDLPVLAHLDGGVPRRLRGGVPGGEDDMTVDGLEVLHLGAVLRRWGGLASWARLLLAVEGETHQPGDAVELAGVEVALAVQRHRPVALHAEGPIDVRDAAGQHGRHRTALAEG